MPVKQKTEFKPFYLTFSSPVRIPIRSPADLAAVTNGLEQGRLAVDETSAEREKGTLGDILGAILWNQVNGMAVFDVKLGRLYKEHKQDPAIRAMLGMVYSPVSLERWGHENQMDIAAMAQRG